MMKGIPRLAAVAAAALLLIGAIAGGTAYAGSAVQKNSLIDETTAEEFAILDAGVEEEDVRDLSTKLEHDNGVYVYDIRFYVGDTEYEYEIRAEDGMILEKDIDKADTDRVAETSGTTDTTGTTDTNGTGETSAADPEAADTGTEAADPAAEADHTDGAETQDTDRNDQQPDADAQTAAAEDAQPAEAPAQEDRDTGTAQGQTNTYISVDEAKQIALDHAGLTIDQVRFSTAKLENDDGYIEYDIEFYMGQMEYEYEIDAVTGEIKESSSEYDDD